MENEPDRQDWIDEVAAKVSSRVAELKAERKRLQRLLQEAETASARLEQIDGFLKVAEVSDRIGAVKPRTLDSPGEPNGAPSAPDMVLEVLRETPKALEASEIISAVQAKYGALPPNLYSAISRLKQRKAIRVVHKRGVKGLYRPNKPEEGGSDESS